MRSFLFFQAEDGIRDRDVTGVQTCALPISTPWGLDLSGTTLTSIETINIDNDISGSEILLVSSTTSFASAIAINGTSNNDIIASNDGMNLSNVTLTGISQIQIDADSATANTVGAVLTLGAQVLPAGLSIVGSGDDIIDAAGPSLDLSGATTTGISQISGSASADIIIGTAGVDVLFGGQGSDTLTGGGGGDVFKYVSNTDSGVGAGVRDTLTDFTTTVDQINIAAIVGGGTFAFEALSTGSVATVQATLNGTLLQFDTTNDGIADMEIDLGGGAIAAGDFVTA